MPTMAMRVTPIPARQSPCAAVPAAPAVAAVDSPTAMAAAVEAVAVAVACQVGGRRRSLRHCARAMRAPTPVRLLPPLPPPSSAASSSAAAAAGPFVF